MGRCRSLQAAIGVVGVLCVAIGAFRWNAGLSGRGLGFEVILHVFVALRDGLELGSRFDDLVGGCGACRRCTETSTGTATTHATRTECYAETSHREEQSADA